MIYALPALNDDLSCVRVPESKPIVEIFVVLENGLPQWKIHKVNGGFDVILSCVIVVIAIVDCQRANNHIGIHHIPTQPQKKKKHLIPRPATSVGWKLMTLLKCHHHPYYAQVIYVILLSILLSIVFGFKTFFV